MILLCNCEYSRRVYVCVPVLGLNAGCWFCVNSVVPLFCVKVCILVLFCLCLFNVGLLFILLLVVV